MGDNNSLYESPYKRRLTTSKSSTTEQSKIHTFNENEIINNLVSANTLSTEQENVFRSIVADNECNFLTGQGGTGKSWILKTIISFYKQKLSSPLALAVTASTGIAALAINGCTLHAFAGIGLGYDVTSAFKSKHEDVLFDEKYYTAENQETHYNKMSSFMVKEFASKLRAITLETIGNWINTSVIIVDEISMLNPSFIDDVDMVARHLKKKAHLPFGGIKVIFCGDFRQLSPVVKNGETEVFGFQSHLWRFGNVKSHILCQIQRQRHGDPLIPILDQASRGELSQESYNTLLSRVTSRANPSQDEADNMTRLFSRKDAASKFNKEKLDSIKDSTLFSFESRDWHDKTENGKKAWHQIQQSCIAEKNLSIKVGATVLLIKNLSLKHGLANGSRGIVLKVHSKYFKNEQDEQEYYEKMQKQVINIDDIDDCNDDENDTCDMSFDNEINDITGEYNGDYGISFCKPAKPALTILFSNGIVATIGPQQWKTEQYSAELGVDVCIAQRCQLPFILAWGLTIHKSQGMTLFLVEIDLCNNFGSGMAYVALSRVTHLEGLYIKQDFHKSVVFCNKKVISFYDTLTVE